MSSASDHELLRAWSRGDNESGSSLVERHFATVHGFLHDKVEAAVVDDLVQVTFVACMEQSSRFRGTASVRTWLLAIARNKLYSYWRSLDTARRARRRVEDLTIEELLPTPSSMVGRQERQRVLVRALRRLPVELQLLLELLYWEELSYVELAAMLEIPVGTVKSRLNRARELLVDALHTCGVDPATTTSTIELDQWIRTLGR